MTERKRDSIEGGKLEDVKPLLGCNFNVLQAKKDGTEGQAGN